MGSIPVAGAKKEDGQSSIFFCFVYIIWESKGVRFTLICRVNPLFDTRKPIDKIQLTESELDGHTSLTISLIYV